jgi:2-polyprenyl-3-methyl-5-hydroxy-6-metoxy-1,4-benzoquinol methylase
MPELTYNPAIFNVNDLRSAMRIILTPETWTTERRWEIESPYLVDLIHQSVGITPQTVLLDYGSGIGRIAKELIARYQCRVVGVDISASMRVLAAPYVQSDRFLPCSPAMLEALGERGFRFDAAIAVWVLQHCLRPAEDIKMIQRLLKPDARLFVVNATYRVVPALEQPWVNDGIDIKRMLSAAFALEQEGQLLPDKIPDSLAAVTFWASFSNRRP